MADPASNSLQDPKPGTLEWAESIDPVFAFWKAHHADACKAFFAKDYDLAYRLCRETLEDPKHVPILYRAEAHTMLSLYAGIDDYLDQAKGAVEQYQRLYEQQPDNPNCKDLCEQSQKFLRRAEDRARKEQLKSQVNQEPATKTPEVTDSETTGLSNTVSTEQTLSPSIKLTGNPASTAGASPSSTAAATEMANTIPDTSLG